MVVPLAISNSLVLYISNLKALNYDVKYALYSKIVTKKILDSKWKPEARITKERLVRRKIP